MRASKGAAEEVIYQIKVALNGSKPAIWRTILVTGGTTLSTPSSDKRTFRREVADERRAKRLELVPGEGFSLSYVYDSGDNGEHKLVVNKILEPEPATPSKSASGA